jgi:hypothetical protein
LIVILPVESFARSHLALLRGRELVGADDVREEADSGRVDL